MFKFDSFVLAALSAGLTKVRNLLKTKGTKIIIIFFFIYEKLVSAEAKSDANAKPKSKITNNTAMQIDSEMDEKRTMRRDEKKKNCRRWLDIQIYFASLYQYFIRFGFSHWALGYRWFDVAYWHIQPQVL